MVVQELLGAKNSKVVTVRPSATLVEAAQALTMHRIGALVVTDDAGRLLGIISERDLTKAIVQYLAGLIDRRVADVMTRTVVTCSPDDSVAEVLYLMNANGSSRLPITITSCPFAVRKSTALSHDVTAAGDCSI